MEIEEFAKEYNKLVDYNLEILNQLGFDDANCLAKQESVSKIVNDYLGFEKITKHKFDYSTAELYEYNENGKRGFELQIYNRNYGGLVYFWLTPGETEKEYKRKKVEAIYKDVLDCSKKEAKHLNELKNKLDELNTFAKSIALFSQKL